MNPLTKKLKKEIIEKIDILPQNGIKELYDYFSFLIMKSYLPKIDPEQSYFWTKKWQKLEKEASEDILSGKVSKTFKNAKDLIKDLKK